ncbi:hypothetical protein OkiPb00161_48390 [Escherichia coli]
MSVQLLPGQQSIQCPVPLVINGPDGEAFVQSRYGSVLLPELPAGWQQRAYPVTDGALTCLT